MKPNRTSNVIRKLLKDLKSPIQVCPLGLPIGELSMPDPHKYFYEREYARDYLAYNIARKREAPVSATQMRDSLRKWAETEFRCRTVNRHGRWVFPIGDQKDTLDQVFHEARLIISRILSGVWPDLSFNPTGGATTLIPRSKSFPMTKVDGTPITDVAQPHKCTSSSRLLLKLMFLENPGVYRRYYRACFHREAEVFDLEAYVDPEKLENLLDYLCTDVPNARLDYVMKDYKSIRLIGLSNSLSIMVQKTIGSAIRGALKGEGVDLDDQTINQRWAYHGSLYNHWKTDEGLVATVDLSSASDSISLRIVQELFPSRWYDYFIATRDHVIECGSKSHKLEMVAGMGNGFIFEMESLLFYAITKASAIVMKANVKQVNVYGDDIICPVECVPLLKEAFLSYGILLNDEKSFASSPFRESCGKHYFNGLDVTPIFIKGDLDSLEDLYHCYNGLSEWQHRTGVDIESTINLVLSYIPRKNRNLVPRSFGTRSGLHFERATVLLPARKWVKKWHRYEWSWVVSEVKTTDIQERFAGRLQVLNALLSEDREDLLPRSILAKVNFALYRQHGSLAANLRSTIPLPRMTPEYKRAKKRDENFAGDA